MPGFQLADENARAVAELCVRLDGLPLAIELAAARSKLFSPQALLNLFAGSPLDLLTGGARDLPARQRTLSHTIQWSYDLLNAGEQRLFRGLSVFVNGFTLATASEVLADLQSPIPILDGLASLVDKSLLQTSASSEEPRFHLLVMVREFALDQLQRNGETAMLQRRHALWALTLAEQAQARLHDGVQPAGFDRLEREHDNLRAALQWALEQQEATMALRLSTALWPFWFDRGYWSEGRRWLAMALLLHARPTPNPMLHAKALRLAGTLARYQGDLSTARRLCEESLAVYRDCADSAGMVAALIQLCRILDYKGDLPTARRYAEEALALVDALEDAYLRAETYFNAATIAMDEHDGQTAARWFTVSLELMRGLQNATGCALALAGLAHVATYTGDLAAAQRCCDEAETFAQDAGDRRSRTRLLLVKAWLHFLRGELAEARTVITGLLSLLAGLSDATRSSLVDMLGALLYRQGLPLWAARLHSLADQMRSQAQMAPTRIFGDHFAQSLAAIQRDLGEAAFATAWAEGQRLTLDDLATVPIPAVVHASSPAPTVGPLVEPLTAREVEVLRLLAQGLTNAQIAETLIISPHTVNAHLRAIFGKLGVTTRLAATRFALDHQLI
jgi:ATP/maltotriose-dependent transcriptional regulator MalT